MKKINKILIGFSNVAVSVWGVYGKINKFINMNNSGKFIRGCLIDLGYKLNKSDDYATTLAIVDAFQDAANMSDEDVEALATIDVLRRSGIQVDTTSLDNKDVITQSNNKIEVDYLLKDIKAPIYGSKMTLTLLDLYNTAASQEWAMYDNDAISDSEFEDSLVLSINKSINPKRLQNARRKSGQLPSWHDPIFNYILFCGSIEKSFSVVPFSN